MTKKANILVVDDEKSIRDMLSHEFSHQGYNVETASDGDEGLECTHHKKFDLVILDLRMPRRGGLETLVEMKKSDPDMEIIVATGFVSVETAVASLKKGAFDYINKPFNLNELNMLVQKALEKKDLRITVALYEACKAMYSSLNMEELLRSIIRIIGMLIGADETAIMLNGNDGRLSLAASHTADGHTVSGSMLEIGENLLARAGMNAEPVILNGEPTVVREAGPYPDEKSIRSVLFCPLYTKSGTWGAIGLSRAGDADEFTVNDLRNLAVFASQTAQAIENAHLYKNLEQTIRELKDAGRKVRESNGFLESVIGSMTDSFAVIDPNGIIMKTNRAFRELFGGMPAGDEESFFNGRRLSDFLPMEAIFGDETSQRIEFKNPVINLEISTTYNRDLPLPMCLTASPVADPVTGISGIVLILRDVSQQKETEKSLKYLATHDVLTDLPNRVLFSDRVSQAISRANRYGTMLAVLLLDLDRFKEINDNLGHHAGDCLLKEVALRLKRCLRDYDTVARMGGDEFVLVLTDITDGVDITMVADRVLASLKQPVFIEGRELHITTSIGISRYPEDGTSLEILLRNADIAMYSAKKREGDTYEFFKSTMWKSTEEHIKLKNNLSLALERNEFTLYYQPLVDTGTGRIIAAEALLRWIHPELGFIEPGRFISIAESTGLIVPIGEWVLREACTRCLEWQNDCPEIFPVSVNLSTRQLYDDRLVDKVMKIIDGTGASPEHLILEITESSAMQNIENSIRIIKELQNHGIQFFLDDFGSGYSSLNWLKMIPVQAIKIDSFFIRHITDDRFDAAIVKAIMAMASSLGIRVIAEGVEKPEQLEFLKSIEYPMNTPLRCDKIQGYLFGRPVPADDLRRQLIRQNGRAIRN